MSEATESDSQQYSTNARWERLLVLCAATSYVLWLTQSCAVRGFLQTLQRLLAKFL